MKFDSVTIKDIAKVLGISASTVSRALKGSFEINWKTRARVQECAEKMNYRPDPIALSLKENRSRSIGVIVPEIANHFFSQAINGIDEMAYKSGYHVVIFQSHESYDREVANTQHLVTRRVDGLLVSLSNETTDIGHFRQLQEKGMPIVFFDRVSSAIETHKVVANNRAGAYQATQHLIEAGCRRIAHLTNASGVSITLERLEGYQRALAEHGIPYEESYVKHCHYGGMLQLEVEQAVMALLGLENRPEAIFAASDRLTTGCLTTLKKAALRVPEDVLLVGFTNLHVADLLHPSLTAVTQPAYEMGNTATELLIQLIESKKLVFTFETRMLETELCVRDSSVKLLAVEPNKTVH